MLELSVICFDKGRGKEFGVKLSLGMGKEMCGGGFFFFFEVCKC